MAFSVMTLPAQLLSFCLAAIECRPMEGELLARGRILRRDPKKFAHAQRRRLNRLRDRRRLKRNGKQFCACLSHSTRTLRRMGRLMGQAGERRRNPTKST